MKKKISIPHLFYNIELKEPKEAIGKAKDFFNIGMTAVTESRKGLSIIYIKQPIKPKDVPTLCHELIHVLQNICESRDISFTQEQEHTAYLFHYMLNEILGYEFQ